VDESGSKEQRGRAALQGREPGDSVLSYFHFVIPNRAEGPVRNLLFAGQTADSSRDETALRNDRFQN